MIIEKLNGMKMEEFVSGKYRYQYAINPDWTPVERQMEKDFRFLLFEESVRKGKG